LFPADSSATGLPVVSSAVSSLSSLPVKVVVENAVVLVGTVVVESATVHNLHIIGHKSRNWLPTAPTVQSPITAAISCTHISGSFV